MEYSLKPFYLVEGDLCYWLYFKNKPTKFVSYFSEIIFQHQIDKKSYYLLVLQCRLVTKIDHLFIIIDEGGSILDSLKFPDKEDEKLNMISNEILNDGNFYFSKGNAKYILKINKIGFISYGYSEFKRRAFRQFLKRKKYLTIERQL